MGLKFEMNHLSLGSPLLCQGLANYSPRVKSRSLPVFVMSISLEYSHPFTYCPQLLWHWDSRVTHL